MKKGISPVVAVVLLVAIAVIASVGVWYWVGAYTGKPNVAGTEKSMTISECNGTHVYAQNSGEHKLDGVAAFYDSSKIHQGYLNFSALAGGGVTTDSANWVALYDTSSAQITTAISGSYYVLQSGYQQISFNC